jgi:hypothetical protein
MPIPLEKIQVVEDKIEKFDDEDDKNENLHTTITPPEQDFSFLNKPKNIKRSVHYDIEPINHYACQPLKPISEIEQPSIDNVLRRRYIAHWGLPGNKNKNLI